MSKLELRKKIQPIYRQLQGYLFLAPETGNIENERVYDKSVWEQFNDTLSQLDTVIGGGFSFRSTFGVEPITGSSQGAYITLTA